MSEPCLSVTYFKANFWDESNLGFGMTDIAAVSAMLPAKYRLLGVLFYAGVIFVIASSCVMLKNVQTAVAAN